MRLLAKIVAGLFLAVPSAHAAVVTIDCEAGVGFKLCREMVNIADAFDCPGNLCYGLYQLQALNDFAESFQAGVPVGAKVTDLAAKLAQQAATKLCADPNAARREGDGEIFASKVDALRDLVELQRDGGIAEVASCRLTAPGT